MQNLRKLATDFLATIFSVFKGRPIPQPKAVPVNRSPNNYRDQNRSNYPNAGNLF